MSRKLLRLSLSDRISASLPWTIGPLTLTVRINVVRRQGSAMWLRRVVVFGLDERSFTVLPLPGLLIAEGLEAYPFDHWSDLMPEMPEGL